MKRRIFFTAAFLFLAACSAPSAEELQGSAQPLAATGVALTLQALPINTQPGSSTPAVTTGSSTPQVSTLTLEEPSSTATQYPGQGTLANALPTELSATEKADKSDNSTVLLLQNNSDQEIWLIVDSPTYFEYRFSDSFTILLPLGVYHYRVWIGDKGPFEGNFRISNHDKHTMIFSAGKVQFQGP